MPANVTEIEKRMWTSADELRANSRLRASEYSAPVLGLIFLRFADQKFASADASLKQQFAPVAGRPSRRTLTKEDYQAAGVLYLPENARYAGLLALPESANVGHAINDAMRAIEADNPELRDVLPKTYNRLGNSALGALPSV